MAIYIPFNFESINETTSSSYTVPVGKYVFAEPLSPACTVDGNLFEVQTITRTGTIHSIPIVGDYRVSMSTASSVHLIYERGIDSSSNRSVTRNQQGSLTSSTTFVSDSNIVSSTISASSSVSLANSNTPSVIVFEATSSATFTIKRIERRAGWYAEGTVLAGGNWFIREFVSLK